MASDSLPSLSKSSLIRDVWAENLEAEFAVIRSLLKDYPFVAMDTEFPGVVAKPVGTFKTTHEFYYQALRCNVNLLKLIQLGITLLNERGEVPEKCCTWQFNFEFSLTDDVYAQDSIELLKNGGINFDYFARHGIHMSHFAELLYSSGLVLNDEIRWLAFHAGYDFGYLMKLLLNRELPEKEDEFNIMFHTMFPLVFDIKYLLRQTDIAHSSGLDYLADMLGVRRFGTAHQSGSDSLLTGHSFFKLLKEKLGGSLPHASNGVLYGLSEDAATTATPSIVTPAGVGAMSPISSNVNHTTSSNNTAVNIASPPQITAPNNNAFPNTPLMSMVMHGSRHDSKVHQAPTKA